jgi:hypothetical protein
MGFSPVSDVFLNCKPINPEGLTRFRGWSGDTHLEMFARTDHPRFGWSRRWMRRWGQASNVIVGAVLEGCSSVWPRRSWPKRISCWFGPPAGRYGGAGNRAGAGIVFDDCRRCGAADRRYTVEGRGTGVARVTERMLARLPKSIRQPRRCAHGGRSARVTMVRFAAAVRNLSRFSADIGAASVAAVSRAGVIARRSGTPSPTARQLPAVRPAGPVVRVQLGLSAWRDHHGWGGVTGLSGVRESVAAAVV